MNIKTVSTVCCLLLAAIAGYLTGGLTTCVVYTLLAGAAVYWKYA